ncbi:MAG: beta strand repeat-containing protein, partial [Candidatus Zixiibacteriota bacterium]
NLNGTGTFTFTPDYTQSGTVNVSFIATDGSLADTEAVAITVNQVDQPPVLAAIGAKSVTEGVNLNFVATAADIDGQTPIMTAENLPLNATYADNLDGTGTFDFNPTYIQAGTYNVLFIASDGALADSETVTITVNEAGNQSPVLASIGSRSVTEGANLNFNISATDPDATTPSFTAENIPANATFVDNGDGTGTFDFNPTYIQAGTYNVLFIASDGALADSETVTITVNEAGNQSPVLASIGSRSVTEGANLNFNISATDPDATTPSFTAENIPANATFVDNGDGTGTFDFNPNYTQANIYNVTFITSDGSLADTEIVAITVNEAGNQSPVLASIGSKLITEGNNLNFNISATDPDATTPTLSTSSLPANASFVDHLDGTGTFNFNPSFMQSGVYQITYYAADGSLTDSEVVTITVNDAGNQSPVLATIGARSVNEGSTLNFVVSSSDPDGTVPSLAAENLPANATFVDNGTGTGSFSFGPSFTQAGTYNVLFIATDGSLSDSETVTITVNDAGNQPPVLAEIGPQYVTEGDNLNVIISAVDNDGTTPIFTTSTLPANATFVDNGNGTGTFDFNPSYVQSGIISVRFRATDGIATDSEVVFITIYDAGNQNPELATINPQSVTEGVNLNFSVSATDPEGHNPTLSTSSLPANATFVDNGNGTGTFDFNPGYTQAGVYDITFYATDDSTAVDSQVVTITVNEAGNQAPVLAYIAPQTVNENANLNFNISASDLDATIPVLSAENVPANATFTDNLDGTGTFLFNPDYFQAGTYDVLFIASDGSLADSQAVTVTVNNINRDPVLATIGNKVVNEESFLNFTVTAVDPDLTALILTTSALPANASFVDNGDGTGIFDFNPTYYQSGTYDITFYVDDSEAMDSELIVITVNNVNQAPVLDPIGDPFVTEGANLNFTVTGEDPDSTVVTLTTSPLPANATFVDNGDGTGTFDFNPDYTQADIYSIYFYISDGALADTDLVFITVSEAGNQPPVLDPIGPRAVNENNNLNFTVTASDPEAVTPTLTAENFPTNASFVDNGNGTGTFDFNPDFTQAGTYNVLFIASDGSLADSETVTITVNDEGNQAPVLAAIGSKSVNEQANLNFNISATDADATTPSFTAENVPTNASFVDNGDGTATFDFNPDYTQAGTYNVLFIASDGSLADSETVTITVNQVNQTPVLATVGAQSVTEGANLHLTITASDLDGTIPLMTASTPLPENASFVDNGDGTATFDFNPTYIQAGIYNVTFYATDDSLTVDSEIVTITVNEAGNQNPVLAAVGAQSVTEGNNLNFNITATDPDATTPSFTAENVPVNATFVDNGDGTATFNFNPNYIQAGTYNVLFIASDGALADSETVTITVNEAGNQAPILASIGSRAVTEGASLNFNISAADADATIPTFSAENVPANATFVDNGNGSATFDFNPNYIQAGTYNVLFIASDGSLADSETVTITVNEAGNQNPVLAAVGAQAVTEGANLNFSISATDPDATIPSFTAENVPVNATFVDNGDGTATFDFNPNYIQAGTYNVLFIASDGSLADSEIVTITVNEAGNQSPVLATIGSKSVTEGTNLNFVISATDPDATTPSFTAENIPANATFTDNGDGTATFDFNPDYIQVGSYNILFIASDGSLADSETVTVTVNEAGNQAPILASIGSRAVTEGASLNFNISAADADATIPTFSAEN